MAHVTEILKTPGHGCVCVCGRGGKQVFCWRLAAGQAVCLYSCPDCLFSAYLTKRRVAESVQA
jgi:hypothetical protein